GAPSVPGEGSLGDQMRHNLLFFRLRHLSFFSAVISSPLFAGGQQKRLQAHSCSPLQESEVFRSLYSIIWGPPLPCLIRNGCVPIELEVEAVFTGCRLRFLKNLFFGD